MSTANIRSPINPDHSLHRRRRHRSRHLEGVAARLRRGGREGLRRQARHSSGSKSSPAKRPFANFRHWLPDDSVNAARDLRVSIKGPLTTPVGGGIRSLNVALRQILDLYSCVRPVKYYQGVPCPVKHPEKLDVVIFRENTEDVYAGIEFQQGTPEAPKLIEFLNDDMLQGRQEEDVRVDSGVGIKPISIYRHQAPGARCDPVRARERTQDRHPRAQGQHPEVHRGRLPRVGLRSGSRGVPRSDRDRARELDPRQRRSEPRPHRRSRTRR